MLPDTLLAPAEDIALFLDFDGTLVHLVERPDLAHVSDDLRALLQATYECLDGALALVTGRTIASLDALLDPLRLPAAGIHGVEIRAGSGGIRTVNAKEWPAWALDESRTLAASDPGLLLEDKSHGIAIHYRQAPSMEARVNKTLAGLAERLGPDFEFLTGKMIAELRPAGISKGTAVERFMSIPPYAGRIPVFAGDDVTDEDAFRAVNAMQGFSIRVGDHDHPTSASHRLPDIAAVRAWLETICGHEHTSNDRS